MGMSSEEPDPGAEKSAEDDEETRRQEEQAVQEAARQAEQDAIASRMQELIQQWEQNGNQIQEVTTTEELMKNSRDDLLATGIVLAITPEGASTIVGLGMIASAGFLYLWDKFVYDKDGRLDVSKLHYTYQPPSLNPIHNQPRNPQFNPSDWEGVVRWAIITTLGAGAIKDYYDQTTVKFPQPSTPINEPDKTRVSMPRP